MAKKIARILPEDRRREVFMALVLVRRKGVGMAQLSLIDADLARVTVAKRFAVNQEQLSRIEQEGITACWPPLD